MSQQNPTIIVGHLDDSELTKSIDKLVNEVANKTTTMAGHFTTAIGKMQDAMKDFAITQKVSVDLMKEAWRDMSKSFDAMVAAQSAATGGGKGSGKGKVYAPDTVGALEQEIAEIKQERKELELNSNELRTQNALLERRKNLYKEQTTSPATKRIDSAMSMSTNKLDEAQKKLRLLEILQRRYAGTTELSVAQQTSLARAIQKTKEQIDKLKPKSLDDVLGMDAKSIDQIAAKMRALKMVQIDPNNAAEVKRVGDAYAELKRQQAQLMGQNIQLTHSNNYLAQSFGYIRNRIVYALTLGAITSFIKQIYEIRGQYELLERSLGVLVNSFERGSQVFNELNQMAIESPFTLMELAGAAKQLTAYNFTANEVVDTTRRLADISAALGVPMERLTYNLGQIRAQTVLNARDARDFANAGLPIVKSLSDYYTELEGKIVSTGDVYDRMSKKMVSYNDVMAVLNKMTDEGGKFFEFQAKQAQTLRVQMANLTLAWNNMLNEMGKGNQGLLSLPIQGLKAMLQNWASLNRVLKNVVLSFGLLKVAQMAAIRYNWQLAASAGGAARMMGFLGNAIKSVFASTKALFTNPWTWIFVGIMAITDLIGKWRAARQEIAELNDELKENAREAANSNFDFFNNKGNIETRKLANENKLTAEQGEKAWEAIEQQISTSAMSANKLIGELWAINDVNERVKKGFDYVVEINRAQAALAQFGDDVLTITQDKGWWGMFGEGLVSDLKDFKKELDGFKGTSDELNKILNTDYGTNNTIKIAFKELQGEIKETAESINNFIVANNIKDPIQINEILSRAKAIIKTRNPEIKGELATLFDMQLDEQMSKFNSNIDKSSSLWEMFMERLKHNSSATFQDITSDIYKENSKLSKEQQNAVDENLEYFKKTMPFYYNAVKDMVSDASRLKIQIGIAFNVKALTDFQQEVNDRIAKASKVLDFGTHAMLPTQNDNLQTWVKTQQDAIKGLREQNKLYKKDSSEWSKEQIKNNDKEIQQRKNLLDLFNQSYEKDKKGGRGGSKKDPMLDTLKQTVDIVKKLQSEYDTLTKSGASSADALDDVRKRYSRTIALLNRNLQGFGLPQLNLEIIKGRNPNDVLEYFQKISDILTNKGLSTLERQKAVEVVIQEFSLKAKTYNLDMITKGLNNELGKLKDEYELAVELDANPELGGMFADMLGIDTSTMSHSIDEYMDNVRMAVDKARMGLGYGIGIDIFGASEDEWQRWAEWVGISNEKMQEFRAMFEPARSVVKKWATDTVNNTKKLEYELAELNDKIAIKEKEQAQLHEKIEKEKNETTKHYLELTYQSNEKSIDELRAQALSLMPEYARVFNSIAEYSDGVSRRLQRDLMRVFDEAKYDSASGKWTLTGSDGKQTILNDTQYRKEREKLTKEMRKSQSPFKKIKEAFKPSDEKGVVDYAKGIELVSAEVQKLGSVASEVGNLAQIFGADEQTVEIINDVATSLNGVATAGQGISQIASGDYIGGAASVLSGITSIIGAWADNDNKRIDAEIKESELAVKRLENAYKNLEFAIESAYGANVIGAKQAAIANKELQLVELERQLRLEKSRDSKDRDEERIESLRGEIIDLRNEIKTSYQEVATSLLGISSVGDAALEFMGTYIDALRKGEDAQAAFTGSYKEMIANMIKQLFVTKVIGPQLESIVDDLNERLKSRSGAEAKAYEEASRKYAEMSDKSNEELVLDYLRSTGYKTIQAYAKIYDLGGSGMLETMADELREQAENEMKEAKKALDKAAIPTIEDMDLVAQGLDGLQPAIESYNGQLDELLKRYDLYDTEASKSNLSALQQGIQGITEDTAGALEAYMNGVSQQVYLHSDLLTQIRDAVVGMDMDIQTATQAQMLLQLQQSYTVQMAIQGILEGWNNPSGQAVRVELVS